MSDVLPYDGSCEDIEPDEELGFLDGFVQQALLSGSQPYSSELSQANSKQENEQDKTKSPELVYVYDPPTIPSKSIPVSTEKKRQDDSLDFVPQQRHDQPATRQPALTHQQGEISL